MGPIRPMAVQQYQHRRHISLIGPISLIPSALYLPAESYTPFLTMSLVSLIIWKYSLMSKRSRATRAFSCDFR